MYAPTSTNSPRSGPTSGESGDGLTDFDGAGEILRAWGNGLRPDPDLTVSEWADRHRMLSGRASAEPGRYRTVRTPYMREIMDRLSPGDPTQRIVFMKAAQVGATEAGNNWIGFAIHQGQWNRIAQIGGVTLGDDVEVGANPTIDRGALDNTRLGNGVKIDNLVQIAHNVQIGDHSAMAGKVGIAGSTRIGSHCIFGGAVGVASSPDCFVLQDRLHGPKRPLQSLRCHWRFRLNKAASTSKSTRFAGRCQRRPTMRRFTPPA